MRGEARFAPGGQPARGRVRLRLRRGGGAAPPVEAGIEEGRFAVSLPASPRVEEVVEGVDLLAGPGLVPVPGVWSWSRARDGSARLEVGFPRGFFLRLRHEVRDETGRPLPPPSDLRLALSPGRVDPVDLAEAEAAAAEGGSERSPDDLVNYVSFRPLAPEGGICRPVWVEAAESYLGVGRSARHWGLWRGAPPPGLAFGATWEAGPLVLAPATGARLLVEVSPRRPVGELRVKPVRLPDNREGDAMYLPLRAVDPDLAEAVYGDGRLDLVPGQPLILAPLPPDSAIGFSLEAPTGRAAEPVRVPLRPGEIVEARLEVPDAVAGETRASGRLHGRVALAGGSPVEGASVEETRFARVTASTDAAGRFTLEPLPVGEELTLRLSGLPGQAGRVVYRRVTLEGPGPRDLAWEVEPYRWIRARGVAPPPSATAEEPFAYVLERRATDGRWRAAAADVFDVVPGGVDVSVDAPGAGYRVGAVWSAILVQWSSPVEVDEGDAEVVARFEPLPTGTPALAGVVLSASGLPEPAVIQVVGPVSGLPPIEATTDGNGRFSLGPANVEEATLLARGASGAAEVVVRPASTPFVAVRLEAEED